MEFISCKPRSLVVILFAAAALAGCAAMPQQSRESPAQGGFTRQEHQSHHPQGAEGQATGSGEQGATNGQGGMMGGAGGQGGMMGGAGGQGGMMGQGGQMDMKSMCDMHERMKSATPQQRGAMMDQYMRNMTPEMRQRHFEMMEQQCR